MIGGPSGAALALTALALFALRAGGLVFAGRLGPRSPWLAWASSLSYALLTVYVVQTLLAPPGSLAATPTSARIAAASLAVAGFTVVGRGLPHWLVIGAAAFSLGIGTASETKVAADKGTVPTAKVVGAAPEPLAGPAPVSQQVIEPSGLADAVVIDRFAPNYAGPRLAACVLTGSRADAGAASGMPEACSWQGCIDPAWMLLSFAAAPARPAVSGRGRDRATLPARAREQYGRGQKAK